MYHLFFNFFVDMASQTALIARHVQDIKWQVLNMTRAISKGFQESKAVVDEVGGGLSDMKGMMKMMDYEAFADFYFLTIAMIGLLYMLIGFGSLGMASMAQGPKLTLKLMASSPMQGGAMLTVTL